MRRAGILMRIGLGLCIAALFLGSCRAQIVKTVVSGTIVDPNGVPYAGGSIDATLVPVGTTPTVAGFGQIDGYVQPVAISKTGTFTLPLYCNSAGGGCSVISPASTQWMFTVRNPGAQPPAGFGGISFSVTLTITGATQNISSQLNTAAPLLLVEPTSLSGGCPGSTIANEIFFNKAGACSGSPSLTYDGSSLTAIATGGGQILIAAGPTPANGVQITSSLTQILAQEAGAELAMQADTGGIVFTTTGAIGFTGTNINLQASPASGELDLGGVGIQGGIGLVGATSGSKATITGPPIAGTASNPFVFSNAINVPGATITGALSMQNQLTFGDIDGGHPTTPTAALRASGTTGAIETANPAGQTFAGVFSSSFYSTDTECSSTAAPAVCGTASAGTVRIAAATSTLQVTDANVKSTSQIFYAFDLWKTGCTAVPANLTALLPPYTSAVTPNTNFTLTMPVQAGTNPVCIDYWFMN